jgi:hypothetical protein
MNKAILIIPVIAILLGITTSTSTTAVQARIYGHYTMTNSNAYDKGFNQAKHDVANNHAYNNSCTPKWGILSTVRLRIQDSMDSSTLEHGDTIQHAITNGE